MVFHNPSLQTMSLNPSVEDKGLNWLQLLIELGHLINECNILVNTAPKKSDSKKSKIINWQIFKLARRLFMFDFHFLRFFKNTPSFAHKLTCVFKGSFIRVRFFVNVTVI